MELSSKLMELSLKNSNILLDRYRIESITAYNRLEPRARSENFERTLRAEIRDPLWMLTRQWQMGELDAEDCGSPIDARITTRKLHVDRIALNETDVYLAGVQTSATPRQNNAVYWKNNTMVTLPKYGEANSIAIVTQ